MNIQLHPVISDPEKLQHASTILKAVAHPLRLKVVGYLLETRELSVNDLCGVLQAEQSLVSHHLINMRKKGVLACRREGVNIYYRLQIDQMASLLDCIAGCRV
jgi:ArsR family transcriptional regulator